jgi:hypothetical protein
MRRYDACDLLASIGALQLLPANACQLGRLAAAARIVASLSPGAPRPAMSVGRLRRVLTTKPFEGALAAHDPRYDDVLCEAVTFAGRSYIVSSGLAAEAPRTFTWLQAALAFEPSPAPAPLLGDAMRLCGATLELSQRILGAAGLQRNALPGGSPADSVTFPPGGRLSALKDAVRIDVSTLPIDLLDPLITDAGTISADDEDGLVARPIVRFGDEVVVALPLGLLDALRRALLDLVQAHGFADELTWRFRAMVERDVLEGLEAMAMEQIPLPADAGSPPDDVRESVFQFDDDKVVTVTVLTDDLSEYRADRAHVAQGAVGLSGRLTARRRGLSEALRVRPDVREVSHLLVFETAGAELRLTPGAAPGGEQMLSLSAAELLTLAVVERDEPLALYKFEEARTRMAREDDFLGPFERLDLYALYLDHDRTLALDYAGADSDAPLAYVGSGLRLRAQAKIARDPHVEPFAPGRAVEVVRLSEEEAEEPIYRPRYMPALGRLAFMVEAFPRPVWLFGTRAATRSRDLMEIEGHLLPSIGFWLWQLADDIGPLIADATYPMPSLNIAVETSYDGFASARANDVSGPVASTAATAQGQLHVRVLPRAWQLFARDDNAGERELMRHILVGLRDLARVAGHDPDLSDDHVDGVVARQFSNPRKKHLLLWDAGQDSRAIAPTRTRYRPVQAADVQEVRLALGEYLQAEHRLVPGSRIAGNDREAVLRSARDRCMADIEERVARLSPTGLLERLILGNEAVAHERFEKTHKLTTRLACYESLPEVQARLRREGPRLSLAAIVWRFLIEYVTAVPPRGDVPLSTAECDRLLALAAEMQEQASALDARVHELSDPELELSPVGVLREVSGDTYQQAQWRFFEAGLDEQVEEAERAFTRHLAPDEPADLPTVTWQQLDDVMPFECGLTLTELREVIGELTRHGLEDPDEAACWPRNALTAELASSMGWDSEKAEKGLRFWELGARGSFLPSDESDEWQRGDVDPWRFHRRLSYNRRPVVVRARGNTEELLWGFRHLQEAWPLTYDSLASGRYHAQSRELRTLRGELVRLRGKAFEAQVLTLYGRFAHFRAIGGRTKFAGERVTDGEGQPIGDIDVLVADPARRLLTAVETKDIAGTLTPSELASALRRTFGDGGKKRSAMDLHRLRVQWLEGHVDEALRELRLPVADARSWRLDGLFVTARRVSAPFVLKTEFPVVAYRDLERKLERASVRRGTPGEAGRRRPMEAK